ncbi:MAG: ribokinase [Homoserinimonas sp.]|nr:ribokinase [Homoserinimonas sp.]
MSSKRGVIVVGSANMDLVVTVERIPNPGETLKATGVANYPGGKGLNQAVAVARSGADCSMIGALGSDENAVILRGVMKDAGIDDSQVRSEDGVSGLALITVAANAENTVLVASGANAAVTAMGEGDLAKLASGKVVLAQLELPIGAVTEAARASREFGSEFILNAAPAMKLPEDLIGHLDFLIVNEHEACVIAELDDLREASEVLAARVPNLIVTLGSAGSVYYRNGEQVAEIEALKVSAVDTTGAGDTYCGAFAAALAEGQEVRQAIRFATAAAALSVQKEGAVPSIPLRDEVDALLAGS